MTNAMTVSAFWVRFLARESGRWIMTSPPAVISGASIAGLSTAFWLGTIGWRVTVLERSAALRDGGQNMDVRGVARDVLDRMGLTEAVKQQNTTETGAVMLGPGGRVMAELPSDGPDGATAEFEVPRGDFARTILDALPEGIEILYGDTVGHIDEHEDAVTVHTVSGKVLDVDLLVIAEGVRSSTHDRITTAPPAPFWSTREAKTCRTSTAPSPWPGCVSDTSMPAGRRAAYSMGSTPRTISTSTGSRRSACPPGTRGTSASSVTQRGASAP
jgi:2-polyprenyl-6-methoxyphenol hydroxylase-like FAD-dependent oxidoreductase